jgi:hypothetical protein
MIEPSSLPPSVLVKVATLEAGCTGLGARLEAARRELQRLRAERRDCVPQTVHDEESANRESERVLAEWARLDDAIERQLTLSEALERRLRGAERIVREVKQFLHEVPAGAQLRVVESHGGDLDDIRARIDAVKGELAQTLRTPTLSGDLGAKIADYVADLASKARPVISGTGDGESLRVLYPLHDHADRVTRSGFSDHEANALLLAAMLHGESLAKCLLRTATDAGITANERSMRLQALQAEMVTLRYSEEAAITDALARGEDAIRSSSQPAWAVLMIEVDHEQQAAAAA